MSLLPADVERLAERREHPLGDADGDERVGAGRQRDDELVAAEAGRHVAIADRAPKPLADGDQEAVAGLVAVGVVDGLEVVEVDEQDGQQPVVGSVGEVRGQPLGEEAAVGQGRQRVVQRLATEQLHERVALVQALAELAQRVAEAGDDEQADHDAADEVRRRIDLATDHDLDRQGRRIDQQCRGEGEETAAADRPAVDVLALGRDRHRRMERRGADEGEDGERREQVGRREVPAADEALEDVDEDDRVRREDEQHDEARRGSMRAGQDPHPGDGRKSDERRVEERGERQRAPSGRGHEGTETDRPDQGADPGREDRRVKEGGAVAAGDPAADQQGQPDDAGQGPDAGEDLAGKGQTHRRGVERARDRRDQHRDPPGGTREADAAGRWVRIPIRIAAVDARPSAVRAGTMRLPVRDQRGRDGHAKADDEERQPGPRTAPIPNGRAVPRTQVRSVRSGHGSPSPQVSLSGYRIAMVNTDAVPRDLRRAQLVGARCRRLARLRGLDLDLAAELREVERHLARDLADLRVIRGERGFELHGRAVGHDPDVEGVVLARDPEPAFVRQRPIDPEVLEILLADPFLSEVAQVDSGP